MHFSKLIKKVFLCEDADTCCWTLLIMAALCAIAIFAVPAAVFGAALYLMRAGFEFETVRLIVLAIIAIVGALAILAAHIVDRWEHKQDRRFF